MIPFDSIDLILLPFYLVLIYMVAFRLRKRYDDDPLYQKYFIRGLTYKLGGAIFFALIYLMHYQGGDSINYFLTIKPLYTLAFKYPDAYFKFLVNVRADYPYDCIWEANSYGVAYLLHGMPTLTTIRIGSFINFFCFNSYLACTVVFAFISYLFIWRIFRLFVSIYSFLEKEFAFAFLMIPSVIFWGSGVGKDSIMLSAIMYFFCCYYDLAIHKRRMVLNIIGLALSSLLMSYIRSFILFTMAPCVVLMTAIYYRNVFSSAVVRFVALPVFLGIGILGSYLFVNSIGNSVESYNIEGMQKTAEGFKSWHTYLGDTTGGSSYTLGDFDYSFSGILRKAPLALVIALFGPFVWQIKNVVMLMSGVESFLFLYYSFKVFFNVRAYRALGILFRDHIIMFCIPFILIIGVAVGITSFNYGALVRYKIPILPFFVVLIVVTRHRIYRKTA